MNLFVDVQGFKDCNNQFIVKELAISTQNFTQVFLIKPPYPYTTLSAEEKKNVRWIERQRGIKWGQGHIDYREFHRIIAPILQNRIVIMKGQEKKKWLHELCDNCVLINVEDKGCPNFLKLYEMYSTCSNDFNCFSHNNYCALKNVICIKKWYLTM